MTRTRKMVTMMMVGFRGYAADGCTDSGCFKTKPQR